MQNLHNRIIKTQEDKSSYENVLKNIIVLNSYIKQMPGNTKNGYHRSSSRDFGYVSTCQNSSQEESGYCAQTKYSNLETTNIA